jgi:kumamolisin
VKPRVGERWSPDVSPDESVTATIMLRRVGGPSEQDLLSGKYQAPGREGAAAVLAADPADAAAVRSFASENGLTIVNEKPESRRIEVRGTATQMGKAFRVQLQSTQGADGHRYLTYTGAISVPKALAGIITSVLGLDQRPVAKRHGQ